MTLMHVLLIANGNSFLCYSSINGNNQSWATIIFMVINHYDHLFFFFLGEHAFEHDTN